MSLEGVLGQYDGEAWDALQQEIARYRPHARFPLLDEEVNPSPFPDWAWRAFAMAHNDEQRELQRIYDLLMEGIE